MSFILLLYYSYNILCFSVFSYKQNERISFIPKIPSRNIIFPLTKRNKTFWKSKKIVAFKATLICCAILLWFFFWSVKYQMITEFCWKLGWVLFVKILLRPHVVSLQRDSIILIKKLKVYGFREFKWRFES